MSGSCEHLAPDFLGYIAALPEFEKVYCIDTKIQHIIKKGEPIPKMVYGAGGTDLNPVFEIFEDLEKKAPPNVKLNFIVLTDGEIPPVKFGAKDAMTLVFTTHMEVHWEKALRPWRNITIKGNKEEVEADV
jgi:predicted metal-dependent peptidase